MSFVQRGLLAALVLAAACSKPGQPPPGQPALTTFGASKGLGAFVERFNQASSDQIQVVALFSPT